MHEDGVLDHRVRRDQLDAEAGRHAERLQLLGRRARRRRGDLVARHHLLLLHAGPVAQLRLGGRDKSSEKQQGGAGMRAHKIQDGR